MTHYFLLPSRVIPTVARLLALICNAEGYGAASFDSPASCARMAHSKSSVQQRLSPSPSEPGEHPGILCAAPRHRHNILEGGCDRYQNALDWNRIYRAVRPLPATQKYPDYEIENREEDQQNAGLAFAGAVSTTMVGAATVPIGAGVIVLAGGTAATIAVGRQYMSAKRDVKKMREHNKRSERAGTAQGF